MVKKIVAGLFALLAVATAAWSVHLALENIQAEPVLLQAPEAARTQVVTLMDALCSGDEATVTQVLYGQPQLGLDRAPADQVGRLFYRAYQGSLTYALVGDCYATNTGVAMDVTVSALDVAALTRALGPRSQQLLEERVQAAEDVAEIYDETGEYREDVVMAVLYEAAKQVLAENKAMLTWDLTLECIYEQERWWVVPQDALLQILGSGIKR